MLLLQREDLPPAFRSHTCELCSAAVCSTHEIVLGGVKVAQNLVVHRSRDVCALGCSGVIKENLLQRNCNLVCGGPLK